MGPGRPRAEVHVAATMMMMVAVTMVMRAVSMIVGVAVVMITMAVVMVMVVVTWPVVVMVKVGMVMAGGARLADLGAPASAHGTHHITSKSLILSSSPP